MANGVFIHREDSIYRDTPAVRYHFPRQYLGRAQACIGDWILYYEPVKVRQSRGYWAVARVESIVPDEDQPGMYYARVEPGSFLQFSTPVPFMVDGEWVERGLLNDQAKLSGRAQAAVRPISTQDFIRIVNLDLRDEDELLPRRDAPENRVREEGPAFQFEDRERVRQLVSRPLRDRAFRRTVLDAYDARCALTGLKLINGGGRAEAEAAHIRPVEANGPDIVSNGLALSGTVHWMFDRGLLSLKDDLTILISRHVNDRDGIAPLLNRSGRARPPSRGADQPHPLFLGWHREHCFKA
ncbi:HNH endonuclease [Sphingomonas sp. KR3-1]|uniref:HNH endonuclease n=1 Tax=Sphingomonas sp. KR3-1 TaxID=3156611 RepID=UPI0032B42AAF